MFKRNFFIYIICSFTVILLFGCNKSLSNNLAEANPRVITHAMGETTVPLNPLRIVTLTNEATEAMLAFDIQPVGAVKSLSKDSRWYSHIKNQMIGVYEVGTENNIEINKITALHPDLIIGSKNLHKNIYKKLSSIAPTIFTESINGSIKGNLNLYAESTNRKPKYTQVINNFDSRLHRVKNIANSKKLLNKKFAIIGFFEDKTYLYLKESFSGSILNQMGIKQIEIKKQSNNQEFVQISKDDFINIIKQVNILIYFVNDKESSQLTWLNDPIFKNLSGTKLEKVYEVNPEIYYSANGIIAANDILDELEYKFKNYKV